jgi:hypothetical protein
LNNSRKNKRGHKGPLNGALFKTVLLAVLAGLLIISLFINFQAYKAPTTRTKVKTLSVLYQRASYNYKALVRPSIVYENKTVINEGKPIYYRLTKKLVINMSYEIGSPQGIKEVEGVIKGSIAISSFVWRRTYLSL